MTAERRNFVNMWFDTPPGFFSRSSLELKRVPFDHRAYEESQQNIQLIINRLSKKRRIAKQLKDRVDYTAKINKLRAIEKDLQKALET